MENTIAITSQTSKEELVNIIENNPAADVAEAIMNYALKQSTDWCNEYIRAQSLEKRVHEIEAKVTDLFLKQK